EGERAERDVCGSGTVQLDQAQHGHDRTPSSSSSATRAGTASVPVPRTSARLVSPGGTLSRSLRRPSGRHSGADCSIAARLARSRAGSEGYRGRLTPSSTEITGGSGMSKIPSVPRYSRRARALAPAAPPAALPAPFPAPPSEPTVTSRFLIPVTQGRP